MKKIFIISTGILLLVTGLTVINSCGKGGTTPNPCSGVTISVGGTTTNPSAPGASDGSISATASGSTGFTYSLNGGPFQSSGNFTNLAAGSYSVVAKNGSGCTGSTSFTLIAFNPCAGITITVTGTVINPTTSGGGTNGSISASATGSTGFTFNINGGAFQSTGNFTNLAAGSYTIVARDLNGCTGSAVFTLVATNPCTGITITVTGAVVNPTSAGATNGSISASASGSTGFTFNINGGAFQSTGNFTNLAAGSYTIVARDLNGCTGSAVFTLTAPNPCAGVTITVGISTSPNVPCMSSNNGSITVNASGGTSPYTYSLNGGAFQTSNIFNNLAAGNYTVTAKDANNCSGSGNATVATAAAGPFFSQVKTLIQNNCAISGCHAGVQSPDFRVDCNIVDNRFLIQQRAVFGIPTPMPPTGLLPASERQKITDWINAGGQFNN